jgi:hypothetical protein
LQTRQSIFKRINCFRQQNSEENPLLNNKLQNPNLPQVQFRQKNNEDGGMVTIANKTDSDEAQTNSLQHSKRPSLHNYPNTALFNSRQINFNYYLPSVPNMGMSSMYNTNNINNIPQNMQIVPSNYVDPSLYANTNNYHMPMGPMYAQMNNHHPQYMNQMNNNMNQHQQHQQLYYQSQNQSNNYYKALQTQHNGINHNHMNNSYHQHQQHQQQKQQQLENQPVDQLINYILKKEDIDRRYSELILNELHDAIEISDDQLNQAAQEILSNKNFDNYNLKPSS